MRPFKTAICVKLLKTFTIHCYTKWSQACSYIRLNPAGIDSFWGTAASRMSACASVQLERSEKHSIRCRRSQRQRPDAWLSVEYTFCVTWCQWTIQNMTLCLQLCASDTANLLSRPSQLMHNSCIATSEYRILHHGPDLGAVNKDG